MNGPIDIIAVGSLLVSLLAFVVSLVIGVLNTRHNDNVDIQERIQSESKRAADMAAIQVSLASISSDTSEIRAEQKGLRKTVNDINERLTVVEESGKSAHKRIDRIDQKLITIELREGGEKHNEQ